MRAMRDWGFAVELACSPGGYDSAIQAQGFKFHGVRIERSVNPLAQWGAYRRLRCVIREGGYAAVHVHTPVAALIGRPAARRCAVPVVVYTAHGFYFHERMNPFLRRVHVGLERWAQRRADFLMTQSAEDCATAVAERIAPVGRAETIGNGVDLSAFGPHLLGEGGTAAVRSELMLQSGEGPVVAMMGRLVREKGYFEFIEAWARVVPRFPKARAVFIGEALGSDREDSALALKRRMDELGIRRTVILAGLRDDVPRLLAAADLFVLPSWREGMPRSILEAMASGLPVIATRIRGCREEVLEGETGFLVPVGDVAALAERLERLLGDEDLRRRMGRAARRRAEAHFDERAVIERQRLIFTRLFAEKGLAWPGG